MVLGANKPPKQGAILVTGGAGFIGRKLVMKLAESGRTVVTMYRHKLPEPKPNVYPVCTDLDSVDLLKAPLRGVDTVIHLAWDKPFSSDYEEKGFDLSFSKPPVNVSRLKNLIDAMELVGTKKIVLASANGASFESLNSFLREKYFSELAVINSRIREKVIIRPTMVFDERCGTDRFISSIKNVVKLPAMYPLPLFKGSIAPVHIDDLIQTIYSVTTQDQGNLVGILEVVGPQAYSVSELFKLVAARLSPATKLQIAGKLGHNINKIIEKREHNHQRFGFCDFLMLSNAVCREIKRSNPIVKSLPRKLKTFDKAIEAVSLKQSTH